MKVLIINISLRPKSDKVIFPIGLGYIATAIKRAGFQFEIFDMDVLRPTDEQIEEYIKKTDFDAVALGCMVSGYKYVKKLAEIIKKYKNAPIIAGNSVATSIPEILMKNTKVDIGVIGEGDITIVELLKAIENRAPLEDVKGIFFRKDGQVFFTPERELILNLDALPFIDYGLFDMKTYLEKCKLNVTEPYPIEFDSLKAFPINTARGCPYDCTFCYHVFKKKRYRVRSTKNVCEEIRYLKENYGVNYIQFFDELTLFSREQASDFAEQFLKEDLKVFWAAECRGGLFKEVDLDLALKLKKAGCVELGYSLESADEEILKAMNKRMSVQDFTEQTKVLRKAGIGISTSLVVGYPQETEESIKKTFDCCYENDIYPSTGYLLPQPGTLMYEYVLKTGKIQDEEEYLLKMGDRQDFTVNLTGMKQEKMEELVKHHLKRIAEKLNLGLKEEQLIKTGHYRQKSNNMNRDIQIKYCKKCIMPASKPDLLIDEEGVCNACRSFEKRKEIDWDARKKELVSILDKYRSRDGKNYDCVIPVSGGKDSHFQTIKMLELGMHPLCVTATTDSLSPIGRRNIENIKKLGVDYIEVTTNPVVRRRINRLALNQIGDIAWPEHLTIFTIPVRIAVQFKVPLIIWGENAQNEYGGPASAAENNILNRRWLEEFGGLLGLRVTDLLGQENIKQKDLIPYTYPTDEELKEVGVTGLYLGHYIPWDGYRNALVAQAYGFETYPKAVEGEMVNYENLDNQQMGIHDYFKFLKYGFGRTTDMVCLHIRRGRLTREEGLELVKMHDGKFPWTYLGKPLEEIMEEIGMTIEEFVDICDRFTNKKIFLCDARGNLIKDKKGNLTKINYDNIDE